MFEVTDDQRIKISEIVNDISKLITSKPPADQSDPQNWLDIQNWYQERAQHKAALSNALARLQNEIDLL